MVSLYTEHFKRNESGQYCNRENFEFFQIRKNLENFEGPDQEKASLLSHGGFSIPPHYITRVSSPISLPTSANESVNTEEEDRLVEKNSEFVDPPYREHLTFMPIDCTAN